MDQSSLVDSQIEEGSRFLARFAADGNTIQAAFWLRIGEPGEWYLVVATDSFDQLGSTETYRSVQSSLQKIGNCKILIGDIKCVSTMNPILKDVLPFLAKYPNRTSAQFGGEPAYMYPRDRYSFSQVSAMTTEQIGNELVRLMNLGSISRKSTRVTMKDGISFNGVPFSLELGSEKAVVAKFVADGKTAPIVIRLDEISTIA